MKKIITLLLVMVLGFSLFAGCKKNKGQSVIDPESLPSIPPTSEPESQPETPLLSEQLADAISNQFSGVASFKFSSETEESYSETYYYVEGWDEEKQSDIIGQGEYAWSCSSSLNAIISIGEDGKIDAKIESANEEVDEYYEDSYSNTVYIIDNNLYIYEESIESWVKNEYATSSIEKMLAILEEVRSGELFTNAEKSALFDTLGEMISVSMNPATKELSFTADMREVSADLKAYFDSVNFDEKTVASLLDDALKLVDENLTTATILAKLEEISNLTVNQAIAKIDAWLTSNYQTTLQGVYNRFATNEIIVNSFVSSLPIEPDMSDTEIEEYLNSVKEQIASFNITEAIASNQLGDVTLFEILSAYAKFSQENIPDASVLFDRIETLLALSLNDFEEAIGRPIFTMISSGLGQQQINEMSYNFGVKFAEGLTVESISYSYTEDVVDVYSSEVEGLNDTSRSIESTRVSITEISNLPVSITIPEGENIVDVFINGWYYAADGSREVGIFYDEEGAEVELCIYHSPTVTINFSAFISNEQLFNNTITIAKEDVDVYINDTLQPDFELKEDLVLVVDTKTEEFSITSDVSLPIASVTVEDALYAIVNNEGGYTLDSALFSRIINFYNSSFIIYLDSESPASYFYIKYEVDYVTGKMYCTVDSIGLESDKSGNLCDPYEGYGWIGSQYEDDKVLAYLSGRDSFVLELTEEGVVTCNDFVEFDAQYIKS